MYNQVQVGQNNNHTCESFFFTQPKKNNKKKKVILFLRSKRGSLITYYLFLLFHMAHGHLILVGILNKCDLDFGGK